MTLDERFWAKVEKGGPDECWPWTASGSNGYGLFHLTRRKQIRAHRYAYERLVGPIPDGLQIDHLCRNRGCCNPAHMEPVTGRENTMRGEGPTARNAHKTHCKYGHPLEGDNLFIRKGGWRACRECYRRTARATYERWLARHEKEEK